MCLLPAFKRYILLTRKKLMRKTTYQVKKSMLLSYFIIIDLKFSPEKQLFYSIILQTFSTIIEERSNLKEA